MPEINLMRRIQVALSLAGARLFRNNVGVGWAGESLHIRHPSTVKLMPGDVVIRNARPLHAGLVEGSSDLIGWTPRAITQEMVGTHVAVFTAVEVKAETGRPTDGQKQFIETVREAGGIAFVARSVVEAQQLMKDPRNADTEQA